MLDRRVHVVPVLGAGSLVEFDPRPSHRPAGPNRSGDARGDLSAALASGRLGRELVRLAAQAAAAEALRRTAADRGAGA